MQQYIIDLRKIDTVKLFDDAIQTTSCPNIIKSLRNESQKEIIEAIKKSGISSVRVADNIYTDKNQKTIDITNISEEINLDFCIKYGVSDYSIGALNYQHRGNLPSLELFLKIKNYSIGSIGFFVSNEDCFINIIPSEDFLVSGVAFSITKNKRKSYIIFYGIHFKYETIFPIVSKYSKIDNLKNLLEVQIGHSFFPAVFIDRNTGNLYTCTCFDGWIDWQWDFYRFAGYLSDDLKNKIKNIKYLENICFLCTGKKPQILYRLGNTSSFIQKYHPYISLESKMRFGDIFAYIDNRDFENKIRTKYNIYKIGERWKHETLLYKTICQLYPDIEFIFHYRGKELEGLELDIFAPKHNIGIEYQGEQHFKPLDVWGGEKTFLMRIKKDNRKRQICQNLKYTLIEFTYLEPLNMEYIQTKINNIVKLK